MTSILLAILYFIIGLGLVVKGADWLTDGASDIARRFNVSSMVIGLTIVAFGTSMPELVVSTIAAFNHQPEMAIGNVVGSNIFNALVIMGLTAMIFPVVCRRNNTHYDLPLSVIAAVALSVMACDSLVDTAAGRQHDVLTRSEGIVLLCFFAIYLSYTFAIKNTLPAPEAEQAAEGDKAKQKPLWRAVVFFALGLGLLILGGDWMVDGAVDIASALGVSQSVIALTIVAAGTSMPELMTSIMAARKGDTDMAIGNVVGSNIFNIFFILGLDACIVPLELGSIGLVDFAFLILSSVVLWAFCTSGHRKLSRAEGIVLLLIAVAYYGQAIVRA